MEQTDLHNMSDSGTRFLYSASLHLYRKREGQYIEKAYREHHYTPAQGLDSLIQSKPQETEFQRELCALFPTRTQINLYVGTVDPEKPSHYMSITRPNVQSLWRIPYRAVRCSTKTPTPGVLVRWGNSRIVPICAKTPDMELRITPILVGASFIDFSSPLVKEQVARCVAISKALQRKKQETLTIWGNPGKTVIDYSDPENIRTVRSRYGGKPPAHKFPVVFHGYAHPSSHSLYPAPCIVPEYPQGQIVSPNFDPIVRSFIAEAVGSSLHNFVGLYAPQSFGNDECYYFAYGYNPAEQVYDPIRLTHTIRAQVPRYALQEDGLWLPNHRALFEICENLLERPDFMGEKIANFFSLLALEFTFDSIVFTAREVGISFQDEEVEKIEAVINKYGEGEL